MLYNQEWDKQLTEIKNEPWRQVLLDAADLIERKGWCQHQSVSKFWGFTLGYCILGAMYRVGPEGVYKEDAVQKLGFHLGVPISEWNDDDSRTKKEVVAKLREVAHG